MTDLEFQVSIDPTHPKVITEPAVAFGDFSALHAGSVVYKTLGEFYVDLIQGRPMPLKLIARRVDLPTLVAMALFLDRAMALSPRVSAFVSSVAMFCLGLPGLAHIDRDEARFLTFLECCLEQEGSQRQKGHQFQGILGWLQDYLLEGRLPALPASPEPPLVVDQGTNGFVLAEGPGALENVVELYRQGYLRGVIYSPGDELGVLAFRKSHWVKFDLEKAASQLNQAEAALSNRNSPWVALDGLMWVQGTKLPREALTQVFLRV